MDPIVPRNEKGRTKPLSIAFDDATLSRIDKISKETHNSRSATVKYLCRWALDAYDKLREQEKAEAAARKTG